MNQGHIKMGFDSTMVSVESLLSAMGSNFVRILKFPWLFHMTFQRTWGHCKIVNLYLPKEFITAQKSASSQTLIVVKKYPLQMLCSLFELKSQFYFLCPCDLCKRIFILSFYTFILVPGTRGKDNGVVHHGMLKQDLWDRQMPMSDLCFFFLSLQFPFVLQICLCMNVMYSATKAKRLFHFNLFICLIYTKILEVNLFAFAYRLFHEDFSAIYGAPCLIYLSNLFVL